MSPAPGAVGVIFEARGIFSAIDPDGNLVAVSSSLRNAVDPYAR
jgi:hypothetical protein